MNSANTQKVGLVKSMVKRRPEYWKSPAILWYLKENARNDPEELIRSKANELLFHSGQTNPPVKLKKILKIRNIFSIAHGDITSLSQLLPISHGFKIMLNNNIFAYVRSTHGRFRFSIAHEIGHTYFYKHDNKIPNRPNNDSGSRAEERLCDIFAAELLMPESMIKKDCFEYYEKYNNWCETIISLQSRYEVSMQALVGRILELNIIDNVIVIKWRIKVKASTGTEEKLRVDWSIPLKSGKFNYVWPDKPAPIDSVFYEALKEDRVIREKSNIQLDQLKGEFDIEARRYNTNGENKRKVPNSVLSLLWLS